MKRSLRNHLARALLEGYDETPERMQFALGTAELVLDWLAAHPDELIAWMTDADRRLS